MKKCFKCFEEKMLDEFYSHKGMADGKLNKCKVCTRLDAKEHRNSNPQYYIEYEKFRRNLPHRVKARSEHQRKIPEMMKIYRKRWEEKYPDKFYEVQRNSRSRRRGAEGKHTKKDVNQIYKLQFGKCINCKKKMGNTFHVDHIIPISRGGSNYAKNLQILCPKCNLNKHAKDPIIWANENGRLL